VADVVDQREPPRPLATSLLVAACGQAVVGRGHQSPAVAKDE